MKSYFPGAGLLCILLLMGPLVYSQGQLTRDALTETSLYGKQVFPPDFKSSFPTNESKKDFRKLREYLYNKEDILHLVQSEKTNKPFYWGISVDRISEYLRDYRTTSVKLAKLYRTE